MFQFAKRVRGLREMSPRLTVEEIGAFVKRPEVSLSHEAVHFVPELDIPGVVPKAGYGAVDFAFVQRLHHDFDIHFSTPTRSLSLANKRRT
jgi:hypothetical protein